MIIPIEELFIKINGQEVMIAGEFWAEIELTDADYDELSLDDLATDKAMKNTVCIQENFFVWDAVEDYMDANREEIALKIYEDQRAAA